MRFDDIICALTVAQEGSFTKAAEKLFVTQSAISQTISKLEHEVGFSLFQRTNKTVTPTQNCLSIIKKAEPIAAQFRQLINDINKMTLKENRHLKIGTISFFSQFLTFQKDIIESFRNLKLEVDVYEKSESEIEQMVLEGSLDFCFTRLPLHCAMLQHDLLYTDHLFLAVSASNKVCENYNITEENPYPIIKLEDLKDERFVMVDNPSITSICKMLCENAGFVPNIAASTNVWERVLNTIEKLNLVGFISSTYALGPQFRNENLRFFRIDSPEANTPYVVAYSIHRKLSGYARKYIDTFKNYINTHLKYPYPSLI